MILKYCSSKLFTSLIIKTIKLKSGAIISFCTQVVHFLKQPDRLKDPIKPKPEINQTNHCNGQRWFFTKKLNPTTTSGVACLFLQENLTPIDLTNCHHQTSPRLCQYVGFSTKCDEILIKSREISTKSDKILTNLEQIRQDLGQI